MLTVEEAVHVGGGAGVTWGLHGDSLELREILAISGNQKLLPPGEENQVLEATTGYSCLPSKRKLKSIQKARKAAISSEEIIKCAHRISASNPMRSRLVGQMNNPPTNGVNGHLPGDLLASNAMPMNMLPPNHRSHCLLILLGHNKENEEDVDYVNRFIKQ
ncbi:unnamed protein product [Nyctereutes procyonoides]|uniref:(raccoon dog) hypothetical protein n=1 Tax=Nyctereutes procyonoides TaxID=34880 RepID=A0A811ZSL2_NYCPR|nr:unnamed protein product [Nyctereutes procyonoides]